MPYLIGIAGPSGAGKTLLASTLAATLQAPIVSLDSYYLDLGHLPFKERARTNFDAPAALDRDLLAAHLAALAAGRDIDVPVYDFTRHARATAVERVRAAGFAIVEGLFALHWADVHELFGTKVYIEAPDDVCFARRLDRDTRERGRSPESVHAQYAETVRPMAALYIRPSREAADVVVSGLDPVAASVESVLAHIEFSRRPVLL